jgi:hypothetical protein
MFWGDTIQPPALPYDIHSDFVFINGETGDLTKICSRLHSCESGSWDFESESAIEAPWLCMLSMTLIISNVHLYIKIISGSIPSQQKH